MCESRPEMIAHLDATTEMLEEDPSGFSPSAAWGLIERWLDVLAEYPEHNNLATTLGEIRAELENPPIDEARVGALMDRLGTRLQQTARGCAPELRRRLERVAALLRRAGRDLAAEPPQEIFDVPGGPQQPSTPRGPNPSNPGRKTRFRL